MPTEKEMIDQLRQGRIQLPPLTIRFLGSQLNGREDKRIDAFIEAEWKRKSTGFVVECKALSTPKFFQDSINFLKSLSLPKNVFPMLFMPFLGEQQLGELEKEGISGIDLCGNGVVVSPGVFSVFRTGAKNQFPSSAAIKNIYRKNSSMVGRGFFVCSDFKTVQDIRATINQRNLLVRRWKKKPMSLSTVSKVLKTMVEDLIIARTETIRLLQPDKLLEKLGKNYNPPVVKDRIRLKIPNNNESILKLLSEQSGQMELPLIASGTSSVNRYTVMPRGDVLTVYCPKVEMLLKRLPGSQTDRFPNLELLETEDESVYFDAREEDGFWWASPLQVYMELMTGDKRDQETAEQLKTLILSDAGVVQS
ncbi:hypothetical protein [uncultured Desulfosarcina sp.]|uniref:hypothetical protein n=1 Tax=uncultured Desulfosarcina sp. TaxID=218289 RepID=UPI0029C704FD|nr:hypothetical protein [uncultured Desulfosarcina sp.]